MGGRFPDLPFDSAAAVPAVVESAAALVAAAAAEDDEQRDDDEPDALVVKDVAQTVVHKTPPFIVSRR